MNRRYSLPWSTPSHRNYPASVVAPGTFCDHRYQGAVPAHPRKRDRPQHSETNEYRQLHRIQIDKQLSGSDICTDNSYSRWRGCYWQSFFFGRETHFLSREKSSIFAREMELPREKTEKNPQKCAWKSFFTRKIFGKSHAWKANLRTWKISKITPVKRKKCPWKIWPEICEISVEIPI